MCVIAISPKGVNAPTEQNLKDMFKYNNDGAGISYVLDKAVYTFKGMMTWADFEKTYALIEKKLKTAGKTLVDVPLVYHFRIGTHGPNSPELTHPFPISNQFTHLSALEYKADIVMAHNGIINSVIARTGWSDTQQYISDIIMPLIKTDRKFYKNKHYKDLMRNTINGSRLVFLDRDGSFDTVGEWVESDTPELKGILYSNLSHEFTFSYGNYVPTATKLYDYSYASSHEVFAAPVPIGAKLYKEKDLGVDYMPNPDAKFTEVKKGLENVYYIDEYAGLYRYDSLDDVLYPMYSFDYAFLDGDMLYSTMESLVMKGQIMTLAAGGRALI